MAIWYIDMPRARTQSGKPICAETLSVLAVVIQAAPANSMASTATPLLAVNAITSMASD